MKLRLFSDADLEPMVQLANQTLRASPSFTPITVQEIKRSIYAQGSQPYQEIALVERDGRLIAFGGILTSSSMSKLQTMMLLGPYVRTDAQKSGIGSDLIAWSLKKARHYPHYTIRTWASQDNAVAHRFLDKFGFEQTGGVCFMACRNYKTRPVLDPTITVQSFREGQDEQAYLTIRNSAPTGYWGTRSMTRTDLERHKKEYFFDPDGVLLAYKDGSPAGLLQGFMDWELSRWAGERRGSVHVCAILPQYRGNLSLLFSLVNAVQDYFSSHQAVSVEFPVDDDKVGLKRLYQRLGMRPHRVVKTYEREVELKAD